MSRRKRGRHRTHPGLDASASMAEVPAPVDETPVLEPGHTYASVTDQISSIVLTRKTSRGWVLGFALSFTLMMALLYATAYLLARGIGIWGTNIPVGWAFPIVNFVWWIGIGHAGTLISAVLLLLHQEWRTSINRFAEAMTLFAVSCAGLFPLLHM
ncbi:MAG TPA: hydrogenase, partial [Schlesneria sp.]